MSFSNPFIGAGEGLLAVWGVVGEGYFLVLSFQASQLAWMVL